jgi:DNA-binding response OmpR family regulator
MLVPEGRVRMASTILVVEDEFKLRELLRSQLERDGHVVLTSGSGAEALDLARSASPDLVILDLRLPDVRGEDVALEIREFSDMAILMLTAKTAEEDRIRGLQAGADDYLTKPFSPRELLLRVKAILRRGRSADGTLVVSSFGDGELVVDESRREARVRGSDVELTPTEWGVLTALAEKPGRVFSRAEIVNRVRGYEFAAYERTVDSHVKNLRRKIESEPAHPRIVLTVLGGGYRFGLTRDG